MRIKAVQLCWFRGAADSVVLEPDCKSMVVYGGNGSGKSSFVDAVEYVLNGGKIRHLSHEYSGRHQEKAVPNTHTPADRKTELLISFEDGSCSTTEITQEGKATTTGTGAAEMSAWEYRRTVLRQDEVAAFIHETKGRKYSALLPLLGLHEMEVAADNLRRLAKTVEGQSELKETKAVLRDVHAKRERQFGNASYEDIAKKIGDLYEIYCPDKASTEDPLSRCKELEAALDTRISRFSADQKENLCLQAVARLSLEDDLDAVREASVGLAGTAEPLIRERLGVLQSTGEFVDKLADDPEVECPACGRRIAADALLEHVRTERQRLHDLMRAFNAREAAVRNVCHALKSLASHFENTDAKAWRDKGASGAFAHSFACLTRLNPETLRSSFGEEDLRGIEHDLLPLIDAARSAARDAPTDVVKLSKDKETVSLAREVIDAEDKALGVVRAEKLLSFITSLEKGIREEIRQRSKSVIDEISSDVQSMWGILHPGEPIENVRLYVPEDTDKAIDIGLKFHGVEQDSARLTLSEGHRNSLGLCTFLAMAKREADKGRPLFLDDAVVSQDREHRGMIVELLDKEFHGRQVIILTHDRDWYTELRHQLAGKGWTFKALLPYQTPNVGIRWSDKTTTFDDARAQLDVRPDSAGMDARKIMDVELALIAESLRINMPYLRAERNDKRTAHDFLQRIVADGKKCLQLRTSGSYNAHTKATDALDEAGRLLVSWGNRASHSFDLVRPEATKLIDVCEEALECLRCSSCDKPVWFAHAARSEWVQCQCGELRWRYGKARTEAVARGLSPTSPNSE